ncbi:MAG: MotA/TolQ/ExbB proton channel family protein [Bacteriovoracaceae bacterium]|nr:MotA/TolQ/ExbB proton channel family protein [Bacteriovoracaceae bacterium]
MRLFEFIVQGGSIMYFLVLMNVVGMSIMFWRGYVLYEFKKNLQSHTESIIQILHKIGLSKTGSQSLPVVKDTISSEVHKLEVGLNTIKIIATIAPLLGLLGTVVGILSAFQVIAQEGLSNPAAFADGISLALITTVGGLVVAIPHYIAYNYIVGFLDDTEISLENKILPIFFGN